MALQLLDLYETTLSASYTAGGTSLTLTSVTGLPASGDYWLAVFDPANSASTYEVFKATSGASGSVVTVTGGQATTTNKSHASGQSVYGGVLCGPALTSLLTIAVNAQTGVSYTLQSSDNGKLVACNNASQITITVPSGLGAGFYCRILQVGAGQVVLSGSSASVSNRQSFTGTAGQYAVVELIAQAADTFTLYGDVAVAIPVVPSTSYSNPAGTGDRRTLILMSIASGGGSHNYNTLVDGSITDTVYFTGSTAGESIQCYFDHPYWITEVRWSQADSGSHGLWIIEGTADGVSWVSVLSSFTFGGATVQTITGLTVPAAFVALRLVGQSGALSGTTWLREIEFKISTAVNPSSTSYANTGGTGARTGIITVTASSGTLSAAGSQLVDGALTGGCQLSGTAAAGQWIQFDFGAAKIITQSRLYTDSSGAMGTWKWQGSPDAATWTDIGPSFTLGNVFIDGGGEYFQAMNSLVSNGTGYRYYRLLGVSGTAAGSIWLREFDFCIS